MTNKCSYLRNQDVLPKCSMFYQAFDTLNQINKLTVDGEPISVELKKELFQEVFLKNKKVGLKQIREYFALSGKCSLQEAKNLTIGGVDGKTDLKLGMSSYVRFKEKFGSLVDTNPQIFEDIIFWHTLNTDKSLVENLILRNYGEIKEIKENIKWLKGLTSFKEFGRLSKQLICSLSGGEDAVTGEIYTILNRLYHTNLNFNQLINLAEYSFGKNIEEENGGGKEEITYEDVVSLYVSPMVRRGIWQALKMIEEYEKAVGKEPDKIFIEVTRQDGKKGDEGRTISRKNKILELYKGVGKDCQDLDELLAELNHNDITDSRLRQERLYLYFLQLGRCAYTGKRISLDQLSTDLYDVDHIIPRSMTKDDSLDNKVLVIREKNAEKSNVYPLPQGFTSQHGFWKLLKLKKLMSDTKFERLIRTKPLESDDFREFLSRQLVVTNQTVKAVAELLKQKYAFSKTKIVYSKAKNVDDFKQKYGIVKCRETNDLHHARDAYLNVVVGNVYDTKFTSNFSYFYSDKEGVQRGYNLEKLFTWKIEGAWEGKEDIAKIKKIVSRTSMKVTRFSHKNTKTGAFYKETVFGKEDKAIGAPRKNSAPYDQTEKYGGFKTLSTAYFAIVQSKDKKGQLIKTIEAIPVLVDYKTKNNKNAVMEYLFAKGLVEPKILIPEIKVNTLVSINGYKVWLAGVTGPTIVLHNAQQWFTDSETDLYVKNLSKLIELEKNGKLSLEENQKDSIAITSNRKGATYFIDKEKNLSLYEKIVEKLNSNVYKGLSSVRSFNKKIQEKLQIFKSLSCIDQVKVLLQIVRFLKCNAECVDLSLLKEGSQCGKFTIGKNITGLDFSIIHQSPCGLFEKIQKV